MPVSSFQSTVERSLEVRFSSVHIPFRLVGSRFGRLFEWAFCQSFLSRLIFTSLIPPYNYNHHVGDADLRPLHIVGTGSRDQEVAPTGTHACRSNSGQGNSIALGSLIGFTMGLLSRSLFIRLILTVCGVMRFPSCPTQTKRKVLRQKTPPILDKLP